MVNLKLLQNNMKTKEELRIKRHRRIKLRMLGTLERPRLVLRRSLKHLTAQAIDDTQNKTVISFSTHDKTMRSKFTSAGNVKAAQVFGEAVAQRLKEKGFSKIIFDRAGILYHGRVKTFADALRKGGLEF